MNNYCPVVPCTFPSTLLLFMSLYTLYNPLVCVLICFSCVQLFGTLAHQAPLSMGILQTRTLEWVAIFLLLGIFPTQRSIPCLLPLLHGRVGPLPLALPYRFCFMWLQPPWLPCFPWIHQAHTSLRTWCFSSLVCFSFRNPHDSLSHAYYKSVQNSPSAAVCPKDFLHSAFHVAFYM